MNSYKITFRYPESGDETAYITERTEGAARKVLFKMYGRELEILDFELHDTNVNATKEQERETLEKIKAMVAELGPSSYLAAAFSGCYEIAEQNIDFDAADSLKERNELVDKENRELREKLSASRSDVEILRSQLDSTEGQLKAKESNIEELFQKNEEYKTALFQMSKTLDEARSTMGDAQRRAEEAEAQVVQLKAKLYDYLTA